MQPFLNYVQAIDNAYSQLKCEVCKLPRKWNERTS